MAEYTWESGHLSRHQWGLLAPWWVRPSPRVMVSQTEYEQKTFFAKKCSPWMFTPYNCMESVIDVSTR